MEPRNKNGARFIVLGAIVLALAVAVTAQDPLMQAREELNQGVRAYKAANYEGAIEHFKNAVRLDSKLRVAKLYLATAYLQQYVPGVDTPENNANAQMAIEQYQAVLADDPNRSEKITSLKGIANLYMNTKNFEASREYYKKATDADPNDPEAYYSVGVIDWTAAYKDISERKARWGLGAEARVKSRQLCEEIKGENIVRIEEGIKMMELAMEKRPDYDDAMTYTSLLYHRKADTECGDSQAYANDLKVANDWVDKAMATRKKKFEAAKKAQDSTTPDQPPK